MAKIAGILLKASRTQLIRSCPRKYHVCRHVGPTLVAKLMQSLLLPCNICGPIIRCHRTIQVWTQTCVCCKYSLRADYFVPVLYLWRVCIILSLPAAGFKALCWITTLLLVYPANISFVAKRFCFLFSLHRLAYPSRLQSAADALFGREYSQWFQCSSAMCGLTSHIS